MVVFMYNKTKYITLFYLLSRVTYSTIHFRIFCQILSGYNREIWYIFRYGRILVKPYPFSYPLITILIRDRIQNYPTESVFAFRKPSVGRPVRNNPFHFHPYLWSSRYCGSRSFWIRSGIPTSWRHVAWSSPRFLQIPSGSHIWGRARERGRVRRTGESQLMGLCVSLLLQGVAFI
jgi:hypothetical protein